MNNLCPAKVIKHIYKYKDLYINLTESTVFTDVSDILHLTALSNTRCRSPSLSYYCNIPKVFLPYKQNSPLMLKKTISTLLIIAVLVVSIASIGGCKTKEGCGLEDKYKTNLETKKRGKSNLFSKKNRKKMR